MAGIWFEEEHVRLKKYSAAVTGPKSTVKVEIEVNDPYALSSLLRQLGEIDREQKAAARPPKPPKKTPPLGLPKPALQLPFYDRGDE
jgi:hypothetical protein